MYLKDLNNLIADSLSISQSEINEKNDLRDISTWDSMNHMLLISKLEESYEVLFTGDEIVEMTSLSSIRNLLIKKGIN